MRTYPQGVLKTARKKTAGGGAGAGTIPFTSETGHKIVVKPTDDPTGPPPRRSKKHMHGTRRIRVVRSAPEPGDMERKVLHEVGEMNRAELLDALSKRWKVKTETKISTHMLRMMLTNAVMSGFTSLDEIKSNGGAQSDAPLPSADGAQPPPAASDGPVADSASVVPGSA